MCVTRLVTVGFVGNDIIVGSNMMTRNSEN